MTMARSGLAIAAGFVVFSIVFTLLGPTLGAVLTTAAAGLIAGYLTAKLAPSRPLTHGGATAGLVVASLVAQPVLTLPARVLVAALSALAITAGAWVRAQARVDPSENRSDQADPVPCGEPGEGRAPEGGGGEERS